MMRGQVSSAELRWLLPASLAVLLFASLPTLYAWHLADADHLFTGFVYNSEDGNSYIAKMRLGAEGEWLFHLPYTPEEHRGALVYTFYLLLGKIGASLGLSLVLTYHLARLLLGLFLLLTVYAFAARFTPDLATRRLAWALVAVGSGLGWLLMLLGLAPLLGALPLDFWVPEAFVFLVLYNLPHLALAEGLLLWALLWTLDSFEQGSALPLLKAGLAAAGMTLVVPFYAGVLAAALGATWLALSLSRRRILWRQAGQAAVVGAWVAPLVAYNTWVFTTNPAFREWTAQNTILSPHPLHYLLGYLPLLVPALPGAVQALRQRERGWLPIGIQLRRGRLEIAPVGAERRSAPGRPPARTEASTQVDAWPQAPEVRLESLSLMRMGWLPLLAWVLIVPLLLYVPFTLQRRMIAGVQVPLALLAASGLVGWFRERTRAWRTWLLVWAAVAALSNLLLVSLSLVETGRRAMPAFRPAGEIAAIDRLARYAAPDDVVLSACESGNLIPARARLRVFLGHGSETLHHQEKQEAVRRFFDPTADDRWRQGLLAQYHIAWVLHGPAERDLGAWDPATAPYLTLVYDEQGYALYRVLLLESRP